MIEDEAKTKWCPHHRTHHRSENMRTAVNQRWESPRIDVPGHVIYFKCIGSDCMMWRCADSFIPGRERGYCGLAGKP